jgi:hypothetical protein
MYRLGDIVGLLLAKALQSEIAKNEMFQVETFIQDPPPQKRITFQPAKFK